MECIVAELDTEHVAAPAIFTEAQRPDGAPHEELTPGNFLRQLGTVIAICLGLATLAHVLVFLVGN
jgi:hypothetical protein